MTKLTKEEYEFIKFYLNATTNRRPDGILVLKHYGLRDGKRIIHSLIKKQILEWNEEDSEMGIYAPISRGQNFDSAIKTFKEELTIETIELPHEEYTDIAKINEIVEQLSKKTKAGQAMMIRNDKDRIMIAEPAINGIWTLIIKNKRVIKIVLC